MYHLKHERWIIQGKRKAPEALGVLTYKSQLLHFPKPRKALSFLPNQSLKNEKRKRTHPLTFANFSSLNAEAFSVLSPPKLQPSFLKLMSPPFLCCPRPPSSFFSLYFIFSLFVSWQPSLSSRDSPSFSLNGSKPLFCWWEVTKIA